MITKLPGLTLLGQYSRWERLGDGLHRSSGRMELTDLLPLVVVVAVLVVVAIVAVVVYRRRDFSKPCDDPQKLFRQLCMVHGIGGAHKRLLLQMATSLQLASPATLFVMPSAFRTSNLPEAMRSEQDRIKELAEKLF